MVSTLKLFGACYYYCPAICESLASIQRTICPDPDGYRSFSSQAEQRAGRPGCLLGEINAHNRTSCVGGTSAEPTHIFTEEDLSINITEAAKR